MDKGRKLELLNKFNLSRKQRELLIKLLGGGKDDESINLNNTPVVVLTFPYDAFASKEHDYSLSYNITSQVIEGILTRDNFKYARYIIRAPYNVESLDNDNYIFNTNIEFMYDSGWFLMDFDLIDNISGFYKTLVFRIFADCVDDFINKINDNNITARILNSWEIPNSTLNHITISVYESRLLKGSALNLTTMLNNLDYPLEPQNYILSFIIAKATNNVYTNYTICPVYRTYLETDDDPPRSNSDFRYYSEFKYENKIYVIQWIDNIETRTNKPYHYWSFKIVDIINETL